MSHMRSESSCFKDEQINSFIELLLGVMLMIPSGEGVVRTTCVPLGVLDILLRQWKLQLQLQVLHASHSLAVSGCGGRGWIRLLLFTSCFQDPSRRPFRPLYIPSASHMSDLEWRCPLGGRVSLQQAATLDVFWLVHGPKELDGLIINQVPEVVEGDVLAALDVHLLQEAVQPSVALRNLQQETRSDTIVTVVLQERKLTPSVGFSAVVRLCHCPSRL